MTEKDALTLSQNITTALTNDGRLCRITKGDATIVFEAPELPRLIAGLSAMAQKSLELQGHPDDLMHFPTNKIDVNLSDDGLQVLLTLTTQGGAKLTFLLPANSMRQMLGDLVQLLGGEEAHTTAPPTKH